MKEELKKYKEMDFAGLESELSLLEKQLTLDILKVKADKLSNYSQISKTRKNIARIKTIIRVKSVE